MNANNDQIGVRTPFIAIAKSVLLLLIPFGLLLAILSYFNLVDILSASVSMLAFAVSIALFIFQKRISVYSILALILGGLFISSALVLGYRDTLSFPTKIYISQIGHGLGIVGWGLAFITEAIAIIGLKKSGWISEYRYSKFSIRAIYIMTLSFIVCGVFMLVIGIFSFRDGLLYLLNG